MMRIIRVTNGGVLAWMESRAPNDPHAIGVVLEHGGGVPWLKPGARIVFSIAEATELHIAPDAYDDILGAGKYIHGQSGAPSYRIAYLVDQRQIQAELTADA